MKRPNLLPIIVILVAVAITVAISTVCLGGAVMMASPLAHPTPTEGVKGLTPVVQPTSGPIDPIKPTGTPTPTLRPCSAHLPVVKNNG